MSLLIGVGDLVINKEYGENIMQIKSVAILGAGAVGSYVIWGLNSVKDIKLGVIAEGERASRLKKEGCLIMMKSTDQRYGHLRRHME